MLLVSKRAGCDNFTVIHRSLQALLLLSVSFLVGCGKKDEPEDLNTELRDSDAAVPGTQVEILPDDPGEGGWETESWSAAIQTQLNQIKSGLLDGNIESALAGLEAEGCQSTRLVPQKREDFGGRVSRLPAGAEVAPAESLAQALVELRELFSQSPRHASAKIVGISSAGKGEADTRVAFQIDAAGIQVNSQWDCRWQQEGRDWKLSSIRLAEFEEVRVPAGAFADATATR